MEQTDNVISKYQFCLFRIQHPEIIKVENVKKKSCSKNQLQYAWKNVNISGLKIAYLGD